MQQQASEYSKDELNTLKSIEILLFISSFRYAKPKKLLKSLKTNIYIHPNGIALTSKVLSKQGTSHLVGNFTGLKGKQIEEIISRIPKSWRMVPQDRGNGVKFLDTAGIERIRLSRLRLLPSKQMNAALGRRASFAV